MIKQKIHYPFHYHEGITIARSITKSKVTINLKELFASHELVEIDTQILYMLCQYEYLNAFLIYTLIKQNNVTCNLNFIKHRLVFLGTRGLVQRFQFKYFDKQKKEHRTPFIYESTYKIKQLFRKCFKNKLVEDIDTILRQISYNQFHILLEQQLGTCLDYSVMHFDKESDGTYSFYSHGKSVLFYVFSIRYGDNWLIKYSKRLISCINYIKDTLCSYTGILVICENEVQGMLAEKYRRSIVECKDASVYYLCDSVAMIENGVLCHLMYVRPEQGYSTYDTIQVVVDGYFVETKREKDNEII